MSPIYNRYMKVMNMEVMGSNPVGASEFISGLSLQLLINLSVTMVTKTSLFEGLRIPVRA